MTTRGLLAAGLAVVVVAQGCGGSSSSSPSTALVTTTTPPSSTTAPSPTSTSTAPTTTVTTTTTTTVAPTTTAAPTSTTEPPDTGTVDVVGWKFEHIGLGVSYIVMNNTNHGIADPKVRVDFVDAGGKVVVSVEQTTEVQLAPGDFEWDYRAPDGDINDLIALSRSVSGATVTVIGSTKDPISVSPVTFQDLRVEPVADVAYGGTLLLGTLVNGSDVDQDVTDINAFLFNDFGLAIPELLDNTSLIRMRPGEELPFTVRTLQPGMTADRFQIAIESKRSPPGADALAETSPVTGFIAPVPFGPGGAENVEVVGELTNTGDRAFAAPDGTLMCVLRDSAGAVVDLALANSATYSAIGYLTLSLETDVEPGATVPFACGNFSAAMAIPGFEDNLDAYTVEVIAQPDAFRVGVATPDPILTPAQTSATFNGRQASVVLTFTNTQPAPSTANLQARVYDSGTGQLLGFATLQYMVVVAGNGVYNIPSGATKSVTVPVDLPRGHSSGTVRIEGTVELGPEFTG